MVWLRYSAYFALMFAVTATLVFLEVRHPGTLRLHVVLPDGGPQGTSEFSPVEIVQVLLLAVCGLLTARVAEQSPGQRPLAFALGGLALVFAIRELDFFLDRYLLDNVWQALIAIAGALLITYVYRHRRRARIALARLWPSPALALLFAGAGVLFAFSLVVGHEPLWQAILGEHYVRGAKLALEEFIELSGYLLWVAGAVEYNVEVAAILKRR